MKVQGGKMVPVGSNRINDLEKANSHIKGTIEYSLGKIQGQVWPQNYSDPLSQSVMRNIDKALRQAELEISRERDRLTQEIFKLK